VFLVPARSLGHRSPPRRGGGSFPHESIPLKVRHVLLAVQLDSWTCSLKVLRPFNDIPRVSPLKGRVSYPPWFHSQAFSASQRFPSRPEFCSLVSCRNRPGLRSPSELSPRKESRTPLEAASSLAVIHRRAETHPRPPCHRRFRQTPTLKRTRLPASPDDYEVPFHAPKHASRFPWTSAGVIARCDDFTRFEALFLPASPFRQLELPRNRRPILSWTSAPLKSSPPAPWNLDPPAPRRARTPQTCERLRATTGDLAAPAPGETVLWVRTPSNDSVGGLRPPSRSARATSRRPPYSHGLG
jgi:hypothetical protein